MSGNGFKLKPISGVSGAGNGGADALATISFTAATAINYLLTLALIAVCVISIYFAISASQANVAQNLRMSSIEAKEASTLGVIMNVNATLQSEFLSLMQALNVTNNTSYNFTAFVLNTFGNLGATDVYLNQSIVNETVARVAKDMVLMQNVSDLYTMMTGALQAAIDSHIKTINGQSANGTGNMLLTALGSGLTIGGSNNTITFNNTGVRSAIAGQGINVSSVTGDVTFSTVAVLDLNDVRPDTTGTVYVIGASGVGVNNTFEANTILVEGSSLVTAITNLQQEDTNQDIKIASLNSTSASLQTQINNLNMTGEMIATALNGTTVNFNMTLMTLVNEVMTLMSQVAALQTQLGNLTAIATPTGTIVPWGGSASPPAGYLACDGSMVSLSTYSDLYAVVGCKFCASMACTMTDFCLPDLRGKLPVAQSTTVGSAFNQVPGTSNVGEEKHTLTTPEMASHTHDVTIGSAGVHEHSLSLHIGQSFDDSGDPSNFNAGADNGIIDVGETLIGTGRPTIVEAKCACAGQDDAFTFGDLSTYPKRRIFYNKGTSTNNGAVADGAHSHSATASSTGSGTPHNVVQPAVIVSAYMIKT